MSNLKTTINGNTLPIIALYASLVIIFTWFGGMKFTGYEAGAIQGLVANSPLIAWTYNIANVQTVAIVIGVIELTIALLLYCDLFHHGYLLWVQ